ncbi:cyclic nucleotide gated channel 1 [Perilla frutescens var. hirtella]|nr:cyclic nucleotide gated channel 1 [Perilla frutescens var. hirtella]KAH6812043.1 cyclic nucleotide gated channel 1 [Perilla frutescens var. frutescens]
MKSLRRSLDPEGPFVRKWNKICVICCLIAVCLDPLLFYIPFLDAEQLCLSLDKKLAITFCVLRSCIDLFYVFHIFLKFIAPTCRVIGAGLLVMDSRAIMKRYLQSYFIMDILSILPLPQVVIVIAPALRNWIKINPLTILITGQNLVRFLRIIPLLKEVTKTSGVLTETAAWSGAISNFCLYMLASHLSRSLDPSGHHGNNSFLFSSCSPLEPSKSAFDYGIFRDALALQLYRDSFRRFFYCFVWGLRNLSSLGQNLETSNNNMGENLFVVVISIIGLILFSFLAGNVQRFLHSLTDRADKMREKLDDKETWMSRTMVPPELRLRVRQYEQYRWQQNGGVDEESLIRDLPKDLRMDIKRHQCRRMLIRVPMFNKMDDQLLDVLCCCLKRVFYTEGSIIVREGYPIDEMLFIKTGTAPGGGGHGVPASYKQHGDYMTGGRWKGPLKRQKIGMPTRLLPCFSSQDSSFFLDFQDDNIYGRLL